MTPDPISLIILGESANSIIKKIKGHEQLKDEIAQATKDLKEMDFRYAVLEEGPGRPSYDPSDMLKLYLRGYYNGIKSSRKLENESHRNMEVMWLIRKLKPDFKTITDFRKYNADAVKSLFRKFNLFLKDQGLFKSHEYRDTITYLVAGGLKLPTIN